MEFIWLIIFLVALYLYAVPWKKDLSIMERIRTILAMLLMLGALGFALAVVAVLVGLFVGADRSIDFLTFLLRLSLLITGGIVMYFLSIWVNIDKDKLKNSIKK